VPNIVANIETLSAWCDGKELLCHGKGSRKLICAVGRSLFTRFLNTIIISSPNSSANITEKTIALTLSVPMANRIRYAKVQMYPEPKYVMIRKTFLALWSRYLITKLSIERSQAISF